MSKSIELPFKYWEIRYSPSNKNPYQVYVGFDTKTLEWMGVSNAYSLREDKQFSDLDEAIEYARSYES